MRFFFFSGLALLFGLTGLRAAAQPKIYTLEAFDGRPTKVTLYDKPFGNPFYVYTATDRLVIDDYWSEVSTRRINRHFLALTYAVRAGTGMGMRRTTIIGINKGKLYQVVHLESHYDEYSAGHARLFDLQLKLTGNKAQNYQLLIRSCNDSINGDLEDIRPHYRSVGTLRFDPVACCFYSGYKAINNTVSVYDPKTGKLVRQKFAGPYPYVRVGTDEYYAVGREWYGVGRQMLFKYSRR